MATSTLLVHLRLRSWQESEAVGLWQRELGARFELWGLVVVCPRGVLGTVAGNLGDLREYVRASLAHPGLTRTSFRPGGTPGAYLPRLTVTVRTEPLPSGAAHELLVTEEQLQPEELRWLGGLRVLEDRVRTATRRLSVLAVGCELCGATTSIHRACVAPGCQRGAGLCNACADFALCGAHRN